jgi:hypothetical protein
VPPATATNAVAVRFALDLKDGARLIGAPSEARTLPFDAAFGRIEIPLALVRAVEFAADQRSVKVRFANGDVLTGAMRLETLRFSTPYGPLAVPTANMIALTAGDTFPTLPGLQPANLQPASHTAPAADRADSEPGSSKQVEDLFATPRR